MRIIIVSLLVSYRLALAQPIAGFIISETSCKNTQIDLTNISTTPASYQWDFCGGSLSQTPVASNSSFVIPANAPEGMVLIQADGNWFGFAANTGADGILRFDFGSDPTSTPVVVNLGNPGSQLNKPRDIAVIRTGNQWYGLVSCVNVAEGSTRVVRLLFGSSITNPPTAQNLGDFDGKVSQAYSIEWVADHAEWIALITDRSQRKLLLVNFGVSPTSTPSANSDFIEVPLPGNGFIKDFSVIRDQGSWNALAITENRNVLKLNFPNRLYQTPAIIDLTSEVSLTGFPNNVTLIRDLNQYYAFILQFEGELIKVTFGNSIANSPVVTYLGNLGTLSNMQGLSFAKTDNTWIAYSNSVTGQLKKVSFVAPCSSSIFSSNDFSPILSFSEPGKKIIALEVVNDFGEKRFHIDSVLIKTNPLANFSWQRNCSGQATEFEDLSTDDGTILAWNWDFGDPVSGALNNSTSQNPNHVYSSPGLYNVMLSLTDDCSESTFITKQIEVNDPSLISLEIEVSDILCSFQPIKFKPLASTGIASVTTSMWDFGDGLASQELEPEHQYTAMGDYIVQLSAIVNQCEIGASAVYRIEPGVEVNFTSTGLCTNEAVEFTTSAPGTQHLWDFGDGFHVQGISTQHTYQSEGLYEVVLTVESANGCINTRAQTKVIRSKPQPNFSIDLPPFSCAGSPSQFNDLTPPLTDSNIATWTWHFGDAANGTSSQKNPTYIYTLAGDYQVSLETETNFGCTNTIQKTITISQAPVVDFTHDASCLNQGTQFQDASGSNVKAWLWSIQNNTYTSQNPIHSFNTTGDQSATLAVTGNNNCVSQVSKTLFIPTPVNIDFTAQSTCASKPSFFQETSTAGSDPATSWRWDFGGQQALGSPVQHVFQNTGNYNVRLYSTRQSGCVYSVSKSISVVAPPVAQFSMSPESGAAPLAVGFTNTSSGASSFLWKFNDANNSTSTLFSPSFTYSALGEYPVDLIARNANGCSDTLQKIVQVVVPQINLAMTELTLFNNGDGSLRANVTIRNDGNLTIQNPDVYLNLAGKAQVKEKISGPVLPGQSITRTLATSILPTNLKYACAEVFVNGDTNQFDNEKCINLVDETVFISPYPNPANEIVYLEWVNTNLESLDLVIYNSLGQPVLSKTYSGLLTGLNQVELYVGNLAEGIYFATYITGNRTFSTRFSIVR
ncbi:MAG: PKD domain-containing protein [Cyclobacteriaceae bacterium]|nr:PKD domain-containing protein [Cyclobacteriaceae bacterium]